MLMPALSACPAFYLLLTARRRPHHALRLAPGQDPLAICERLQAIDVKVRCAVHAVHAALC